MASNQSNNDIYISHKQAIEIVEASVPKTYTQKSTSIETLLQVSHHKAYAPFADTIRKLESIVHSEKDKEIYQLNLLLENKTKQLEECEKMLLNLNEYIFLSHIELGKIFGSLKSLTPFTKKGATLCFGPLKTDASKKNLVQLLGKLSTHFSSNQENLRVTMTLLQKGSSMLRECQDQVFMRNLKSPGQREGNGNLQETTLPPQPSPSTPVALPFSCYICQAQFEQHSKLMQHLSVIHNFALRNVWNNGWQKQLLVDGHPRGGNFKCRKCAAQFHLHEHLEEHLRGVHGIAELEKPSSSV